MQVNGGNGTPAAAQSPIGVNLDFGEHETWDTALNAMADTPAAADIIVASWGRVRMWIRRRYCSPRMSARLSSPEGFAELNALVSPENPSLGALEFGRQGGFVHGSHRYRVMRVKVLGGEEYTLRVLPAQVPTPSAVLLPEQLVKRFVELEDGLVVFAGATGHGKTTSIAALVGECARKSASRIISIEDPVEYIHPDLPNGSTFSRRRGALQGVYRSTGRGSADEPERDRLR
jgi:hypothetical protein